jgi:hypothetical protein
MGSGTHKQQAKKLADDARGNIKAKRLCSSGTGRSGAALPNNYLHEAPILTYFSQGEQPHYFFYNESKGVRIGKTRAKSGWSGSYRNAMWVTDRGVHFTVGKSNGDFHQHLPYDEISSVTTNTGLTKNKFVLETDRGEARFPTDPSMDVERAQRYMERQCSTASTASATASNPSSDGVTLTALQRMDEYDFEHLVAAVWDAQGWTTEVTTGAGDRGVDVTAVKTDPFEQRQYIQAKRYSAGNKVGSEAIQKYSGLYARNESVDAVVVVTTSEFTSESQAVAANRNVKLIDGEKLRRLIERYDVQW